MSKLTWSFILRTFKRVDMIASHFDAEALAGHLLDKHPKAIPSEYLSDVSDYMHTLAKKRGIDLYAHPNGNCPQCGNAISRDHRGAQFCSTACRQRAYRVRRAGARGRNSPMPKRRRTKPTLKELAIKEVTESLTVKREALAFANDMYALHLAAHGDEEKRSAEPQGDVSSVADDKRNVAQDDQPPWR